MGGTRNSMVVNWPARIEHDPEPRDAFVHLVDIVPTFLEAAALPMPTSVNGVEQKQLEGASFLASFTDPSFKGRKQQYFEVFSNRSMYSDGRKANTQHTFPWRQVFAPGNWAQDEWELYNLDQDFSEAKNLVVENPERLKKLKQLFTEAAERYDVFRLGDCGAARLAIAKPPVPGANKDASTFTSYSGAVRTAEAAAT